MQLSKWLSCSVQSKLDHSLQSVPEPLHLQRCGLLEELEVEVEDLELVHQAELLLDLRHQEFHVVVPLQLLVVQVLNLQGYPKEVGSAVPALPILLFRLHLQPQSPWCPRPRSRQSRR